MDDKQRFQTNQFNQQNCYEYDEERRVYRTVNQDGNYCYAESGSAEEKPCRGRVRFLSIIAGFLVLAFLFVYGSNFIITRFINNQLIYRDAKTLNERYIVPTHPEKAVNNQKPAEANQAENLGEKNPTQNQAKYLNKSFSLEEAAGRPDRVNLPISEIVKNELNGVVAITTERMVQTLYGSWLERPAGSGFIISEDGYIVTNNHVVASTSNIKVLLENGKTFDAELVGTDPLNDLAVLKIDPKGEKLHALTMGNSDDVVVGELAIAIGNPSGTLSGSVSAGIISALERNIKIEGLEMILMQTDAAINSGNSGGALFNSRGEVIGINTAKLTSNSGRATYEGLGFAIPINIAKPVIESLIRYGFVKDRTILGIEGQPLGQQVQVGEDDFGGVYITKLLDDGSAAQAGLQVGDVIIEFDGQRVRTPMDINNIRKNKKPGDQVKVVIMREGERKEIELTLVAEHKVNVS